MFTIYNKNTNEEIAILDGFEELQHFLERNIKGRNPNLVKKIGTGGIQEVQEVLEEFIDLPMNKEKSDLILYKIYEFEQRELPTIAQNILENLNFTINWDDYVVFQVIVHIKNIK